MFCLSVGEKNWAKVLEVIKQNCQLTNLFEIRLDYLEEEVSQSKISGFFEEIGDYQSPYGIYQGLRFIFTFRHAYEGGKREIPEEERLKVLRYCLDIGADLVDLEWQALKRYIKKEGKLPFSLEKTLVSFHDFRKTPSDKVLKGMLRRMSEVGVSKAKVVCYSDKPEDGVRLLSLIPYGKRLGMDVVAFGMGDKLSWTRVVSLVLGAPFTYVSQDKGNGTAPGQLSISLAKKLYEGLAGCIRSTV